MKKLSILLFCLISIPSFSQLRFIQAENIEDYETIIKTVQQNKNLLFVAVHDGSGDFKRMYNDGIFNDGPLVNSAQAYTSVAISIDDEMGERFTDIFAVDEAPSFFIMNDQEFVLDMLPGYQTALQLRTALAKASQQPYRYDSLVKAYQAYALSDKEWVEFLELYALNFDFKNTAELALEYLNSKNTKELLQMPALDLMLQYGVDLETPYPNLVKNNLSVIKSVKPDFDYIAFLNTGLEYNFDLALLNADSNLVELICRELVISPMVPADSLSYEHLEVKREFASQTEIFGPFAKAFLREMDKTAPNIAANLLFDEAYEIVENYNSSSALSAALVFADLSDTKLASFRAKMLKAYIAYLQEEFVKADTFLGEARKFVKSSEQLRSLEKLQKIVDADQEKLK
jgi:hypothetical protein